MGTATEVDMLRRQARKAWSWFEETVADVSADQANWWPPGTAAVEWDRLREYGRAVHNQFLGSLDAVSDSHLDMPVDMTRSGLGMWEGRDLFELHGSNHPHIHGGEIACLKGLQGGIGWAESAAFRAPSPFKT